MTGESGDCKVNPNNQSRERRGREEGRSTVRAIHEDWDREKEKEREVDEISPELQCVHYGPFRQLSWFA